MSKPTPKSDALRAMRESNAEPVDDDATARVAALLIRAQHRLIGLSHPYTFDEQLIHDLARMLAAAVDEADDYLRDDQIELPGFLTREPRG